ncbi:MAG TPA: periplasmic heavy metal sensor [Chitinophagaceae bacterium]|nr:periplasmic heavy metal sensor [Chitinophagaceae bacterium]
MNTSRNKILLFLIGILLVTNVVLLVFSVNREKRTEKQPHTNRPSRTAIMKSYLKDSIGFSEQQLAQFDKIRAEHDKNIKPLFDEMRQAKLAFYTLLKEPGTTDSAMSAAAANIAEKQKAVDMAFYKHFRDVRMLCTPDQQAGYDSLVQQIIRRMVAPPKRGEQKQRSH